jgi:hypothetical protein
VSLDVFDPQTPIGGLEAIPPGWEWVVDDARSRQEQQRAVFPGIAACYDRAVTIGNKAPVPGEVSGGRSRQFRFADDELDTEHIVPDTLDDDLVPAVARAVMKASAD